MDLIVVTKKLLSLVYQKRKNMTTQNKINELCKISTTEILILKAAELFGNLSLTSLYVAVIEELENRIGEEETDFITDNLRQCA